MQKSSRAKWIIMLAILALVGLNYQRLLNFATAPFGVSLDAALAGEANLQVPPGFQVNVYARGLEGPRLMAVDPNGTVYVAEQSNGRVSALPDANHDGKADARLTVGDGFDGPNSVEVYSGTLIVGEHTQVSQVSLGTSNATPRKVLIPNLPLSGFHHTKTAIVGGDGRLYVALGSTCNACLEEDARRAAVSVYSTSGHDGRIFARGLRNAVGLALNPWNGEIWATNNGRDLMGNDIPPETLYSLQDGGDYGWPRCHAGNIVDPENGGAGACKDVIAPLVTFQAHMAPLGLAFYKEGNFPQPYNSSVYVAFHGSWNRSSKVGYKVMRVPLKRGKVAGSPEDFVTGFLHDDGSVSGRPAGVAVARDGSLLVSDDKAGLIYRVSWQGNTGAQSSAH
ncbi:MAG: PQQ-dependent sugar dehydrogenase [Chloroflexota bacterium]|nr:PQQ-dependent sugar dehydrogenase [Chloroflexota bacterium]